SIETGVADLRKARRLGVRIAFFYERVSAGVLDFGFWTVAAISSLGVPLAGRRLVFDYLGVSRPALLCRRAFGSGKSRCMVRKAFREHAIYGVGPAIVMFDDLVDDVGH